MQDFCLTDKKPISYTMTPAKCADLRHGHEVQLDIESLDGDTKFRLDNVLNTRNHPFSSRQIATNEDFKWSYLRELSLPETGDKGIVIILIGSNRPGLIDEQLKRKEGDQGEHYAVRTPLGWTIHFPIGESFKDRVSVKFTRTGQDRSNIPLESMLVCFEAVFCNFTQRSSPQTAAENRGTFLSAYYPIVFQLPFSERSPRQRHDTVTPTNSLSIDRALGICWNVEHDTIDLVMNNKEIPQNRNDVFSTHPRRPRGSQSGRGKRRDERFQPLAKEPQGTDYHLTISVPDKSGETIAVVYEHPKRTQEMVFADWAK